MKKRKRNKILAYAHLSGADLDGDIVAFGNGRYYVHCFSNTVRFIEKRWGTLKYLQILIAHFSHRLMKRVRKGGSK